MNKKTTVAGYLRMSGDKQDKSIESQRGELTAYATKNGFDIIAWYVDEAISGWKVGSSRVDLQACKLEYSIVSPK